MLDKILALTKSETGFFGGTWKSKKFSLVMIGLTASMLLSERLSDKDPQLSAWVFGGGLSLIAVYVFSQSIVEACAARSVVSERKKTETPDGT